jgi:hypothetical protein
VYRFRSRLLGLGTVILPILLVFPHPDVLPPLRDVSLHLVTLLVALDFVTLLFGAPLAPYLLEDGLAIFHVFLLLIGLVGVLGVVVYEWKYIVSQYP